VKEVLEFKKRSMPIKIFSITMVMEGQVSHCPMVLPIKYQTFLKNRLNKLKQNVQF